MSANLEDSAGAIGLERSILVPIPKKGNTKECSNHWKTALISYASKVMLKILHCRQTLYHLSHQGSPKKGSAKECSNHWTFALISDASKVILKILHSSFQHLVNQELPDVQAGFRKGRGTRNQIANIL